MHPTQKVICIFFHHQQALPGILPQARANRNAVAERLLANEALVKEAGCASMIWDESRQSAEGFGARLHQAALWAQQKGYHKIVFLPSDLHVKTTAFFKAILGQWQNNSCFFYTDGVGGASIIALTASEVEGFPFTNLPWQTTSLAAALAATGFAHMGHCYRCHALHGRQEILRGLVRRFVQPASMGIPAFAFWPLPAAHCFAFGPHAPPVR